MCVTCLQVLLGITLSWLICFILTVYDVLPPNPEQYGHLARTDLKGDVVGHAPWFRFPYPGRADAMATHTLELVIPSQTRCRNALSN